MRVLITGGFGFLGGRIAVFLVSQGHEVFITSRKKQDIPYWCPSAKVVHLYWNDQISLRNACNGMDLIVHASGINASDCESNPSDALLYNAVATADLVDAAVKEKVSRFIFLSTSHVYCNPLSGLISEQTCTKNIHPYGTSNRAGENSVLWAHAKGSIQGIVFRLSNIIGAPAHKEVNVWNLLANDLCYQAVTSGNIILNTTGDQYRNFLGVNSFLNVLSEICKHFFIPTDHTIFNIGNNYSILVREMAKLIKLRCDLLLGKDIILQIPALSENLLPPIELRYSNQKIKDLGISIIEDLDHDIDSIIHFCKTYFRDNA
jgi:UDP-glucose 4-epimerase